MQTALDNTDDYTLKNACEELTQALQAVGRFVDDSAVSDEDGAMDADFSGDNN